MLSDESDNVVILARGLVVLIDCLTSSNALRFDSDHHLPSGIG